MFNNLKTKKMETLNLSKFANLISEKKSNGFGERSQMYNFLKNEEGFEKTASFLKEMGVIINRKQENSQIREKIRKLMERFFWLHDFKNSTPEKDLQTFEFFEIVYKNLYTVNDFSVESLVNVSNHYYKQVENFLSLYKKSKTEVKEEVKKEKAK
jgi:hypothetical protein